MYDFTLCLFVNAEALKAYDLKQICVRGQWILVMFCSQLCMVFNIMENVIKIFDSDD